ncbi:hypothetical protein DFA_03717 [Cavenderia fasciculata]|uniref:MHD2 domain-containing protein n=1 Tax=Cavenderia fasciculata TaxID=261658 RepID=F4Q079_CACFS|nr:uncharacterized protein DFA_03717 [Cavenderia fasciculata]EGG18230.1 hypothetical protein DFA_03717 [Cavenderia fasciculata]|eukprot:XP_004357053.1 hypothetical protein DFA_03717 [Cavenderia fasciculata]
MASNFQFKLSGIFIELKNKESKSITIQCEFGNLKKFVSRSPVSSVSSYDFQDEFETICLLNIDQLSNTKLKFTISESNTVFDSIVGHAQIDLLTIATGPIQHSLDVVKNNNNIGNITFWALLSQKTDVKITMKDVMVEFTTNNNNILMGGRAVAAGVSSLSYFLVYYTDDENSKNEVQRSKTTTLNEGSSSSSSASTMTTPTLGWKKMNDHVNVKNVSPLTLCEMNLLVKLKSTPTSTTKSAVAAASAMAREVTIGECELPLSVPLSLANLKRSSKDSATGNVSVQVREPITKTGLHIGTVSMTVMIENVPIIAQQIRNLNRDKNNSNPYAGVNTTSTSTNTTSTRVSVGKEKVIPQLLRLPSSQSLENLASLLIGGGGATIHINPNQLPQWKDVQGDEQDDDQEQQDTQQQQEKKPTKKKNFLKQKLFKSPKNNQHHHHLERQVSEKNLFEIVKAASNNIQLFKHEKSTLDKQFTLDHPIHPTQPSAKRSTSNSVVDNDDKSIVLIKNEPLNNIKAYGIIRAILCLYSNNTPKNGMMIDEKTIGPCLRDSFGIGEEQYVEVSKKILECSPKQITEAELLLRYAWKDNHPIYKSEGFRDPTSHEKWRQIEINDITSLLKENYAGEIGGTMTTKKQLEESPPSQHPSVKDIFGSTLKKHTLNTAPKKKKDGTLALAGTESDIHMGYKELVKAFVQYTLGERYNNHCNSFLPMKESIIPSKPDHIQLNIQPELAWILKEYCLLYGIRDFYRHLVVFGLLVKRFDDTPQQLNLLYSCFIKLVETRKTSTKMITMNEERKFYKLCTALVEQLKHRLSNYRLCYRVTTDTNIRAHKQQSSTGQLSTVLRLLDKIIKSLEWQDSSMHSIISASSIDSNEKDYKTHRSKFQVILQSTNPFYQQENCLEIFTLSLQVADICKWLKDDFIHFNSIFNMYQGKDEISISHIETVIETFSKFIRSDLSIISNKFINVDVRKNIKMESPAWLTGILVELVPNLIEFNNLTFQYCKKKTIPLDQNLTFFCGSFVLNSINLLERYIDSIMSKQEWKANGKGILHTAAPIDLFSYIWQCFKSIQIVEDKMGFPSLLLRSFGAQLDKTFYLFIKGLRLELFSDLSKDHQSFLINSIEGKGTKKMNQLLKDMSMNKPIIPNQSRTTTFITEKMCLQLNDIEESRCLLDQFDSENNNLFGDTLLDVFKYLKYHWRCLICFFVYKMDYQLRPLVWNIAFGRDNTKGDIDNLIEFLDRHLKVAYLNLYPRLFSKLLKYLFKMIMFNFIEILLPKSYDKKIWTLNTITNLELLVESLIGIFHVGNEGLSIKTLRKEMRRVVSIMELFSFSVEQLKIYYRMLIESHILMDIQPSHSVNDIIKVMEYFEIPLKKMKLPKHTTVIVK